MNKRHIPGVARFLGEHFGTRRYYVRRIGHVSVANHGTDRWRNPSGRPWHLVCWGANFDTPEEAIAHAVATWDAPTLAWDNSYARQEALMCGPGRFEQP